MRVVAVYTRDRALLQFVTERPVEGRSDILMARRTKRIGRLAFRHSARLLVNAVTTDAAD